MGFLAKKETDDILTVQFSLQINQADDIFGGLFLQFEVPVSHFSVMSKRSFTYEGNKVDLEVLISHLLANGLESLVWTRFGIDL